MKLRPVKTLSIEMRGTEEQYHKMVEEVEDYAILMLDAEGHIVNWNRGAEKIKGYKETEVIGCHFRIFYPVEDQAAKLPETLMQKARETGKAVHEGWRVRKDGTKFWGSIVITALHDSQNQVIGFSKVTRDLTERKQWEDRLRDYARQLEVQNQELQQFAYMAAHDMKEPLRKIQYYHSLVVEETTTPEKQNLYLKRSSEAAGRMQGLIDDLLAFTRITEPVEAFEQVDLNAVVAEVWQFYIEAVDRIEAQLSSDLLPTIHGIAFQVRQLIVNLIGNSIKYRSPDRALSIRITATRTGEPDIAEKTGSTPRRFLKISVTDNGIGFETGQSQKIFEIFQRLHRRDLYPGAGIGLAICRKVMDNHKGYIVGLGMPGHGASFDCYFPI